MPTRSRVTGRVCFLSPEEEDVRQTITKVLNIFWGNFEKSGGSYVGVQTQDTVTVPTCTMLSLLFAVS